MNKRLEWLILIVLAAGGIFLWCRFSLPRFQSIDLSISQPMALQKAKEFLQVERKVDIKGYEIAVSFDVDDGTDRYLQKTIGNGLEKDLLGRMHYDLFCWVVRFFKEKQKEEYKVAISSATGEVTSFHHIIEDSAFRPTIDKEKERQTAFNFLKTRFGFNPSQYISYSENVKKFDNRLEYSFIWQDKRVDIPWNSAQEKGHAKFLTNITISGNEILSFGKSFFEIPDSFNRYVDNLKQIGQNLTLLFKVLYLALLTFSIMVVVNHKQQVVSRTVRPFYFQVGMALFVLMIIDVLNGYQSFLFDYSTSQSLGDYVVRQFIEGFIGPFFIVIGFVLPALAGESLRYEITPFKKERSFLSQLLSSFCSRKVARQLFIGYFAAALILGVQAYIFNWGFKYCGVWDELSWLTQASTAIIPVYSALVIGLQASFSEETMFRLFAINFFMKFLEPENLYLKLKIPLFKNSSVIKFFKQYRVPTLLAVFLSAAIWGFGHTGYEIYPMWFRGLEVTSIGIIMGIFYLRFGIICVIAAHYLIDSSLFNLPYLLNPHATFNFYSALLVFFIPLILAIIAQVMDRGIEEKPISTRFNPQQQFNYNLLKELCTNKTPEELLSLKKDLERHGWDAAIIYRVFDGSPIMGKNN